MPEVDEQVLVEWAQHDAQAFGVLYDRYIGRIYAYIYRQTNDERLTQDVTSATFEKALRHLQRYRWQGVSFCAWLYKIAHNELAQYHRKQRFFTPLFDWHGSGVNGRMTETAVQSRESHSQLHMALKRLSERDREVLTLRYLEELSNPEVAEVLGCSVDNIYLRLHRALQRLRQQMEAMGIREQCAVDSE